jgi:ribonuclease J
MRLKIHRGSSEIGGTCIKLSSDSTTILLDIGLPLVEDAKPLTLPTDKIDAVLVSHPHQDHFGLLDLLPVDVPVYTGPIAKELFQATRLFLDKKLYPHNFNTFKAWQQFEIGDFKITPYLMDHSAPDAYAFEIECDGKRLFFSGDFRAHGRKAKLFENLIKKSPQNIDVLLMEGTMMERGNEKFPDESSVEEKMVKVLKNDTGPVFLICSAQNIDRIVSAYRAAKRSSRFFVVDIYTAWILEKIAAISKHTPKIEWPLIKVLSRGRTAANHYKTVKANPEHFGEFVKSLYKKGNMITVDEIAQKPSQYFIKSSYVQLLKRQLKLVSVSVVYSMWEGYLDESNSNSYLPKLKKDTEINLISIHTSGHAVIDDLKRMVAAIKPKKLIPIHTEHGQKYDDYFSNVLHLKDGDSIQI